MDNASKDLQCEDDNKSNEGQTPSTSATAQSDQPHDDNVKNKTVKQIIDEVLNCTVIHVPNEEESETRINKLNRAVVKSNSKTVTVKEILGEILQYNVCKRLQPSSASLPHCNCGCDIPPYAPSTSTHPKTRSELDVTLVRNAPVYSPFQIYSSGTLKDTITKNDTFVTGNVSRLLPSYSSVLRQGPIPKQKSTDSFVPKLPPPSYAEVEGICDDIPSAVSSDSVMFGPDPLYLICPVCRIIVMTEVERERSAITHWIALILCLFLCWPCCLLPYYMKSCSYSYHSCPNCGHYFGMYNPF